MRKLILVMILVLGFVSLGMAADFKVNPKFYWSSITPFVINPQVNRWGLTVLSFDGSLFRWGNFYFPAAGIGLQIYQKKVLGWHTYYDYWGYPRQYYGYGYKFFFEPYLKFVPAKYQWAWAKKVLKIDSYLELGFAVNPFKKKKEIFITLGLSFSGNPFKTSKKK